MDQAVSAADATRRFSHVLRAVRNGRTVIVTSHGKPIAKITPFTGDEQAENPARLALLARLSAQAPGTSESWTRDELYDGAE